jgi:hypothetical protein
LWRICSAAADNFKATLQVILCENLNSGETAVQDFLSTICTPAQFLFCGINCIWAKAGILK